MKSNIKKLALNLLTLIMIFSLCISNTSIVKASDSNSEKHIYLALGDSITYGYEPSGRITDECFTNILAKEKGYTLVNESVIGNTAVGIMDQLNSGKLDSTIKKAQIITITCGGNDLMNVVYSKTAELFNNQTYYVKKYGKIDNQGVFDVLANSKDERYDIVRLAALTAISDIYKSTEFKTALQNFITNLKSVTKNIKEKNPNVKIYVATQYNPYAHFEQWKSILSNIGKAAELLREDVINNASSGDYIIADVYNAFDGNTKTYCNAVEDPMDLDFHPSIAGHAAIAKCFSKVVPKATIAPDSKPKKDSSAKKSTSKKNITNKKQNKSSKNSNSPDTGDDSKPIIPITSMSVSSIGIIGTLLIRRKYYKS